MNNLITVLISYMIICYMLCKFSDLNQVIDLFTSFLMQKVKQIFAESNSFIKSEYDEIG